MQRDKACAIPVEPNELHQRIKELEELMRPHDLDEGHEWPGASEDDQGQSDGRD